MSIQSSKTRRKFLKIITAGSFSAVMLSVKKSSSAQKRPNIIFYIVDDQVKEELACYGGKVLTPHIDRLAREGVRFDNGHTVSNVCTPSRYTMFTGRYPGNSYFKPYLEEYPKNRHGAPGFNVGLEDDNMNVGNILRLSGYVTGQVGKLHVGPEIKRTRDYVERGLYDASGKDADPDDPKVIAGWKKNELWYRQWIMDRGFSWAKHIYWGNIHSPYSTHNPEWTLEAALEFIENNRNKPFYLHYTTTMMHGGPNNWKQDLEIPLHSGAGKLDKLPKVIPSRKEIKKKVDKAGFSSSTYGFTWMDATVGAMLDKLDKLGIADNTLFVFVSDHGTDGKWSLYDNNGTSIPFIMRWPDRIRAKSVSQSLVQTTDMVPTFFDIAGAEVPKEYHLDGRSIKPILSDPKAVVNESLYFELGCARAVRTQKWKYIAIRYSAERFEKMKSASLTKLPDYLAIQGGAKHVSGQLSKRKHSFDTDQLYDLSKDPLENKNLAKNPEFKDQLKKMRGILTQKLKRQGRPFGEFVPGEDSVPIEKVQPYLDQLKKFRPVKKGLELIDGTDNTGKNKKRNRRKKK